MTEEKSWYVHEEGFILPKGEMLVCLTRWAHLGSDFGGWLVWLLPGDIHSSIIYSFHRYFFELSLGTRFHVRLLITRHSPCSRVRWGDGKVNM